MKTAFFIGNIYFLLLVLSAKAQTNTSTDLQSKNILEEFVKELTLNPSNPLAIDNAFLVQLAGQVNDPNASSLLLTYSKNLSLDEDLSFRQVYYDLYRTLGSSPSFYSNPQYDRTYMKLDFMFDQYDNLLNELNVIGTSKYDAGMFVNNPEIISSLTNITGKYEAAMGIALGAEMILVITEAIQERQQFKRDYIELAKLSSKTVYLEKDPTLSKALIDACLLRRSVPNHRHNNLVTPIYRYDFKSGASLRVENGMLVYRNLTRGINMNVLRVERKHDLKFHSRPGFSTIQGGKEYLTTILISPDEKYFYVNNSEDDLFHSLADKNSKYEAQRGAGYVFNAETGKKIHTNSSFFRPKEGNERAFFKDSLLYYMDAYNNMAIIYDVQKNGYKGHVKLYRHKSADIPIFSTEGNNNYLFHCLEKDGKYLIHQNRNGILMLNILVNDKKGFAHAEYLKNEIIIITSNESGDLYFIDNKGFLRYLAASSYSLDENFVNKVRLAPTIGELSDTDKSKDVNIISNHGNYYDRNVHSMPQLSITMDSKYLVFLYDNFLQVFDVSKGYLSKTFHLEYKSYNSFFSRENNEWVINILGVNTFGFSLHKKYALSKLMVER